MKNSCLLLLCILTIQTTYGQQNRVDSLSREMQMLYQHKIDSLQKLIKAQPSNDSNKVTRLFLLSENYFSNMQYANGLITLANAKALADQLHYAKGEGLYLQAMSLFHNNSILGF